MATTDWSDAFEAERTLHRDDEREPDRHAANEDRAEAVRDETASDVSFLVNLAATAASIASEIGAHYLTISVTGEDTASLGVQTASRRAVEDAHAAVTALTRRARLAVPAEVGPIGHVVQNGREWWQFDASVYGVTVTVYSQPAVVTP